MGKNLWLRAKAKANIKPEVKVKVVWDTCDEELRGEMKSANENYFKVHLKLPKVTPFYRNLCKIFGEKQYINIVYSYIT